MKKHDYRKGKALINCLANVDLNPIRAGIVEKPEEYRFAQSRIMHRPEIRTISYRWISDYKSLALKIKKNDSGYTENLFMKPVVFTKTKKIKIKKEIVEKERNKNYKFTRADSFKYRTRYFSESGIIGSKAFITENIERFKHLFPSQSENIRTPRHVMRLEGIYSLKRLDE